jgi:putative ABC transport system permease protein
MNTIIKLAFRNVGRNRRRSILALVSVAMSLMLVICMQGWISGIMGSVVKNYTKNETGHVRISTAKFGEKSGSFPVTENIKSPEKIISIIKKDPLLSKEISSITQRINFGVLLSNGGKTAGAIALGGDPEKEKSLLMLQQSILPGGKYISGPHETVIGCKLAERLGYKVGDTLKIVTSGSDYALRLKKATISGIYKTNINFLDEDVFQIPLESATELLGMNNETQQILIFLKDWRKSQAVASQIRLLIPDKKLSVKPWTEIGDYYNLVTLSESAYRFIYLVVAFLGAFIISNIMMMVVMERRREIGILKSMGMTRREILYLFLFEGMILGLEGSLIGIATGAVIITILGHTGIDISPMMQAMKLPIDNIIYPGVSIGAVIGTLLLGTVISAFVSILPSRRASVMKVVEAIKSV